MGQEVSIIHLTAGNLFSGAGKGVYTLHDALLREGVNSKILCTHRPQGVDASQIEWLINNYAKRIIFSLAVRISKRLTDKQITDHPHLFSFPYFGWNIHKSPHVRVAQIIHLHWINGSMVTFNGLGRLAQLRKPIVWTIRDMWPFTGGCHYSLDCDRYHRGCGDCPLLKKPSNNDITSRNFNKKAEIVQGIQRFTAVGISPWIKKQLDVSPIFQNKTASMIWNSIDLNKFRSSDIFKARIELGLEPDGTYICVGAIDPSASYKGSQIVKEVLKMILYSYRELGFFQLPEFLVFGKNHEFIKSAYPRSEVFGLVSDPSMLNLIYAASDTFLMPSVQEAFGKTVVESMASGTPVVCFHGTGPADIVEHQKNGYLAKFGDINDLIRGILYCLKNKSCMSANCIEKSKKFSGPQAAKKYLRLYQNISHPSPGARFEKESLRN